MYHKTNLSNKFWQFCIMWFLKKCKITVWFHMQYIIEYFRIGPIAITLSNATSPCSMYTSIQSDIEETNLFLLFVAPGITANETRRDNYNISLLYWEMLCWFEIVCYFFLSLKSLWVSGSKTHCLLLIEMICFLKWDSQFLSLLFEYTNLRPKMYIFNEEWRF